MILQILFTKIAKTPAKATATLPVPMDIDLTQRKVIPLASCFRCGKPRHFSKDCPDRFDVWNLSTDELQELLEDRLAQLDVATPEPGPTISAGQESVTEDFPKDNEWRVHPRRLTITDSPFCL